MSVSRPSLWGIILAGGEGERLKALVREQLGSTISKQPRAFLGRRSLLERSLRRARLLVPSERIVISAAAHHNSHILQCRGTSSPGTVVLQPADRGTVPGILLPLIHVLRKDPYAVVAILPADHFILPSLRFMRAVATAAKYVEDKKVERPILLAVKPDRPEPDYDWIEPGRFVEHGDRQTIRHIERFVEKPPRDRAERLMKDGWLWNTMVVVAHAKSLMGLARKHVPDLAAYFTLLQMLLGTSREQDFVEAVYRAIPKVNFSSAVLARKDKDMGALVLPARDVWWSDLGTKERMLDTVASLGSLSSVRTRTPHERVVIPA